MATVPKKFGALSPFSSKTVNSTASVMSLIGLRMNNSNVIDIKIYIPKVCYRFAFFPYLYYLQCKGFFPLWIYILIDCVSLKFRVPQLYNAQGVAFSCKTATM